MRVILSPRIFSLTVSPVWSFYPGFKYLRIHTVLKNKRRIRPDVMTFISLLLTLLLLTSLVRPALFDLFICRPRSVSTRKHIKTHIHPVYKSKGGCMIRSPSHHLSTQTSVQTKNMCHSSREYICYCGIRCTADLGYRGADHHSHRHTQDIPLRDRFVCCAVYGTKNETWTHNRKIEMSRLQDRWTCSGRAHQIAQRCECQQAESLDRFVV